MRDEILSMLRRQFREEKELILDIGQGMKNYVSGHIISEYSFVLIKDSGIIYHDPARKEGFYDGGVDCMNFQVLEHFRLKMNFKPLLPWLLEATLIDVFAQKRPKRIIYSQQAEKELFKL